MSSQHIIGLYIQQYLFLLVKLKIMDNDKYVCDVCDWIYDPATGDPDNGIQPGTPFADLPDDWVCPICGVGKDQFSKVE